MTGPISPMEYVWGMLFIFILNCFISIGKSKTLRRCYLILSSFITIVGTVVIFTLRSTLILSLSKPRYEVSSVKWLVGKYDEACKISMITLLIMLIILLTLLFIFKKKGNDNLWNIYTGIVIFTKVIIFIIGFYFSLQSVNKIFDLASFILALTISEISILHIVLIIKRLIMNNHKEKENKESSYV